MECQDCVLPISFSCQYLHNDPPFASLFVYPLGSISFKVPVRTMFGAMECGACTGACKQFIVLCKPSANALFQGAKLSFSGNVCCFSVQDCLPLKSTGQLSSWQHDMMVTCRKTGWKVESCLQLNYACLGHMRFRAQCCWTTFRNS